MNERKYVDYVYDIVKGEAFGLDSIYEDYIQAIVGSYGLRALVQARLLECCGAINDRKLYVLVDKER